MAYPNLRRRSISEFIDAEEIGHDQKIRFSLSYSITNRRWRGRHSIVCSFKGGEVGARLHL